VLGVVSLNVTVNLPEVSAPYIASMLLNISDGSWVLSLAPIILSSGASTSLRFTNTKLDQDIVRVGPFITSSITGQLVLEGYLLATSVRVAFHSEAGFFLNFTLSGDYGVYLIDIVPSGFTGGKYDVYAVAVGPLDIVVELPFAQIQVFSDYSMLIIVLVGICAVVVAVKIMPRFLSKRQGGQG
jgi:hypothetical protein